MRIASWGQLQNSQHEVVDIHNRAQLVDALSNQPGIPYGMGRSYGDACLNPGGNLWRTTGLNQLIEFDQDSGLLTCEAGVLLQDIQRLFAERGWMLSVTPGTQLVTVGGAIANDVHGKNHHVRGSFSDHVHNLQLIRTNGESIQCGPSQNSGWFDATVGGLGLTGIISTVTLQLRPVESVWLNNEIKPFNNLKEFFTLSDQSEEGWEYNVSWIDCLPGTAGRGLFMRANHSEKSPERAYRPRSLRMPFQPPISLVNRYTLRAFNSLYFHKNRLQKQSQLVHYQPFFYPLDNIKDWNRMYGPKGFYQYQCVIPRAQGLETLSAVLDEIGLAKQGSFLAVLKTFGHQKSRGMLGFPRPGVTLALDFPNHGDKTEQLFRRLDSIVQNAGGALYLAKDARMPQSFFEAAYPRHTEFRRYRDPGISSAMSRRLFGN